MVKEDCEMEGGEWVESHTTKKGTYVKGFCRKKNHPRLSIPVRGNNEITLPEKDETSHSVVEYPNAFESGASRNIKLPKSNVVNAKRTMGSIKMESGRIKKDISRYDFTDAEFQSKTLEHDAEMEANEDQKLSASQKIKAEEVYAQQKKKIAGREYKETKSRISSESTASKKQIKQEKKRIRHEKRQQRRESKFSKLQSK